MKKLYEELRNNENVRSNLSSLRQYMKDESTSEEVRALEGLPVLTASFLESEDAKTRKNAALLLGKLGAQEYVDLLWEGYQKEQTNFVKGAYLEALLELDTEVHLEAFKAVLEELMEAEVDEENRKHVQEQIRALRKIIIKYEGIEPHTFVAKGKACEVLLLCNREQREVVKNAVLDGVAKVHPLGVLVQTSNLIGLCSCRLFREMLFPIHTDGLVSQVPKKAATELWKADLFDILSNLHKEIHPFHFRIECKSSMTLEERSLFSKRLAAELEQVSGGLLINSTSDYEVEIRLIANREGHFFAALKLYTFLDKRFLYRKNTIAASMHPSTAALIMELAEPYLKENAQIMDPFCGVGTMLIERDIKVPAREIYATDIFGEAIEKGRENAKAAGERIQFIHRDFFDFKHEYRFDEIITNMPIRGKKTKEEMDEFYQRFFTKLPEILAKQATIILYTNEVGFVKKQLRIHPEFVLQREYCMQKKNDFYLFIIEAKG